MQLICARPPILLSSTSGLLALALIKVAEKSEVLIGRKSPSNVPPAFFRFLTKLSCSVRP